MTVPKAALQGVTKQVKALTTTTETTSSGGLFGSGETSTASASAVSKKAVVVTQTTSSLDDLVVSTKDSGTSSSSSTDAADKFRDYGIVVLPDIICNNDDDDDDSAVGVSAYSLQAASAFEQLCREQLEPRGLQVDGDQSFDFAEVRQRPGHRVDNRYRILEPQDSPIAVLSRRLVRELPKLLFPEEEESAWQLLYAGVVHSFPRSQPQDPVPEAQLWHQDGPSVFTTQHHVSHCITVCASRRCVDGQRYDGIHCGDT